LANDWFEVSPTILFFFGMAKAFSLLSLMLPLRFLGEKLSFFCLLSAFDMVFDMAFDDLFSVRDLSLLPDN